MATSAVEVGSGVDTKIWDVIASADADTTLVIAHGMPVAPEFAILQPLQAPARISLWTVLVDAVNIQLFKTTGVGSGNAGAQLRVIASRRVTANR